MGFIDKLTFCGAKPGHVKTDGSDLFDHYTKRIARKICSDSAHFYGQMEKVGQIASATNFTAFQDFNVNPKWVSVWVQRKKISWKTATKLYLECGNNVRWNIANLEDMGRHLNTMAMMEHRDFVLNYLAKHRCKFVDPPGWQSMSSSSRRFGSVTSPTSSPGEEGQGRPCGPSRILRASRGVPRSSCSYEKRCSF